MANKWKFKGNEPVPVNPVLDELYTKLDETEPSTPESAAVSELIVDTLGIPEGWEPVEIPTEIEQPGVTLYPVKDLEPPEPPPVLVEATVQTVPEVRVIACEFPVSGFNPATGTDYTTPTCGRTPAARCEGHRLKYYVCAHHWREAHPPSCKTPVPPFPLG